MVLTSKAADRWLKLESLQIDKSQLLMSGKVSLIENSSKGTQKSLNFELSISFNRIFSSFALPVARKNLLEG